MKKKLKKIINHFGRFNQKYIKTTEELGELIEAINKVDDKGIFEEMCDCLVMFDQLKLIQGWTDEEIEKQKKSKINRTIERIESGYY